MDYAFTVDNGIIKTKIWDTAGHERYRSMNASFYKEAKGALLVADISRLELNEQNGSVGNILGNDLEYWITQFKSKADPDAQIVLVGNKIDLREEAETARILEEFSQKYNLRFMRTSAKTGENVDSTMNGLVDLINKQYFMNSRPENRNNRQSLNARQSILPNPSFSSETEGESCAC